MEIQDTEYLLKEFDKLKDEVSKLLEEIKARERYSLTVMFYYESSGLYS